MRLIPFVYVEEFFLFSRKYPSLDDIGSELINVVDRLNIPQTVIFGEGAGANIACRFAIEHPSRVHGLVLVHPTGTTAGFMEMMKDKLNNWKLIHKGMNPDAEAYLIWHRFGRVGSVDRLFIVLESLSLSSCCSRMRQR